MTDASSAGADENAPQGSAARVPTHSTGAQRARAGQRGEREARARRALFVACLAGFVGGLGLIAIAPKPPPAAEAQTAAAGLTAVGSGRVLAEVPITELGGSGDGRQTIIRIVAPAQDTAPVHVRTRATG